jgi:hypothetical protein
MLEITHALVGAAIGNRATNIGFAFLFGWLSHHILDMIPHFDRGSFFIKSRLPRYLGGQAESLPEGHLLKKEWLLIFFDLAATAVVFGGIIISNNNFLSIEFWSLLIGASGAVLPDFIATWLFWFPKLRKISLLNNYSRLHSYLHWTLPMNKWWLGVVTQVAVILGVILI